MQCRECLWIKHGPKRNHLDVHIDSVRHSRASIRDELITPAICPHLPLPVRLFRLDGTPDPLRYIGSYRNVPFCCTAQSYFPPGSIWKTDTQKLGVPYKFGFECVQKASSDYLQAQEYPIKMLDYLREPEGRVVVCEIDHTFKELCPEPPML